jgi:hypothetical protein
MGEISKWLLHDDQKELFEVLFAMTLNIVFLGLIALLLWLPGRAGLAFRLAKGYAILWVFIFLVGGALMRIHGFFRVNLYDHADAFVNSNLAASCFLQLGWSAFSALSVHSFAAGASLPSAVSLYLVGFLSCLVAFYAVSSFYQGHIYRLISLPLALVAFIVFSVWPAIGRALYGWLFNLFGFHSA